MADRFPLILNTSANQIQEIASGDTLDLTGNNISNAGVITATSFSGPIVAGAGTSNITAGIITAVTFKGDGDFVELDVDGHTNLDNVTITGVSTFAGAIDLNSDLDVDGHTNLDNVSIAGVVTATTFSGSGASLTGIANANISASAAIAGSKISPNFVAQNIFTTGTVTSGDINISDATPTLTFTDTDDNPDFSIAVGSYALNFQDITNSVVRLKIASDGKVSVTNDFDVDGHTNLDNVSIAGVSTFAGAIDLNADLDVDGHTNLDNVSVAGVTTMTGALTISNTVPHIDLNDTDNESDYRIRNVNGTFQLLDLDQAGGTVFFQRETNTDTTITGNLNVTNGVDVTGNVIASGNVTGVNGVFSGNVSVGGVLTYEDVTNVDSVGIVTARNGIKVLAGGANVVGVVTATGGVFVPDNTQIQLGNAAGSADLRIHSNGTESFVDSYGGNFYIRVTDQAGGVENKLIARPNAQTELYYNDTKRLETTSSGISVAGNAVVTGNVQINDSNFLNVGNSGDLRIYHDQVNTINYINSQNGNLRIQQGGLTIIQTVGQGPKLYYGGNEKLATTNTGVTVTGTVAATSFSGDGSNLSGISVGITTEQVTPSSNVATLNLAKDDHKIVASGTYTIDVSGGSEASTHTLRIENSGTANVGFSTYFKFPSGGTPSLPTASGAISLVSFSVHKVGSVGVATVLLAGASVNFS